MLWEAEEEMAIAAAAPPATADLLSAGLPLSLSNPEEREGVRFRGQHKCSWATFTSERTTGCRCK